MPIYLVKSPMGDKLVEAMTRSSAVKHVMRHAITVESLNPSQLVKLIQNEGMKVEQAGIVETPIEPKQEIEDNDQT